MHPAYLPNSRILSSHLNEAPCLLVVAPILPAPPTPTTTTTPNAKSTFCLRELPFPGHVTSANRTARDLPWPPTSAQQDVAKVHPGRSPHPHFPPFRGRATLGGRDGPRVVYLSVSWGTLRLFPPLASVVCFYNIVLHCLHAHVLGASLGGTADPMTNLCLTFWGHVAVFHTFHGGHATGHSHWPWVRVPSPSPLCQHLSLSSGAGGGHHHPWGISCVAPSLSRLWPLPPFPSSGPGVPPRVSDFRSHFLGTAGFPGALHELLLFANKGF